MLTLFATMSINVSYWQILLQKSVERGLEA
jgi:hypothetical protein